MGKRTPDDKTFSKVVEYYNTHFKEKDLQFNKIADLHQISPSKLRRIWNRNMNDTPQIYLINLKLNESRLLLANTRYPVKRVADMVGFENSLYFSRRFKIKMKMSPQEYRKLAQSGGSQ